jgi:hypothetical protein
MKQKITIGFSIILLLAVVYLISKDLFSPSGSKIENPCEYNIDKLKEIDTALICYKESAHFEPQIGKIKGLAVTENNNLIIAGTNQIAVFDINGKKISGFRTDSSAQCIACNGNSYYMGVGNHVEHYTAKGIKVKSWMPFSVKSYLTSIVVSKDEIIVADAGSKRVLKYNKDGVLLLEIGKKDKLKSPEGFVVPSMYLDVSIGAFNDLWVANPGKHRIENYAASGEMISSWGIASMQPEGFAGCCNPVHFAMLPNGNFVTYEKGLDRIKIYDPTGKFVCVVAGPGNFKGKSDFHCSQATLVNDMATDSKGNIYVLDAYDIVRVFSLK